MLTVADIMTSDVVTVTPQTTVRELAELFTRHRIGSIPVVDSERHLLGMVTETDLVERNQELHIPTVIALFDAVVYLDSERKFQQQLQRISAQTVGELYRSEVLSLTPETSVSQAAELLASCGYALPVVSGGRLVGIVARIDLIRSMVDSAKR